MEDPMNAPDTVRQEASEPQGPTNRGPIRRVDDLEIFGAAQTNASILFTGGAHARSQAHRIHSLSGWRWGPFLTVDCGAPQPMLEQQLFDVLCRDNPRPDVEPGARLLQAGTIFLQDVGNLSPAMQVRLADALSHAATNRGASGSRWRVMASTQEPLLPRVLDGTFDDRLHYRLNAIHFVLAP